MRISIKSRWNIRGSPEFNQNSHRDCHRDFNFGHQTLVATTASTKVWSPELKLLSNLCEALKGNEACGWLLLACMSFHFARDSYVWRIFYIYEFVGISYHAHFFSSGLVRRLCRLYLEKKHLKLYLGTQTCRWSPRLTKTHSTIVHQCLASWMNQIFLVQGCTSERPPIFSPRFGANFCWTSVF